MWNKSKNTKPPYRAMFNPLPDITTYELALVLAMFEYSKGRTWQEQMFYFEKLPDSVKRHFDKEML